MLILSELHLFVHSGNHAKGIVQPNSNVSLHSPVT